MEEKESKEIPFSRNKDHKPESNKLARCLYSIFASISATWSKAKTTIQREATKEEDTQDTRDISSARGQADEIQSKTNGAMKDVLIVRTEKAFGKETLGNIFVFDGKKKIYECVCLELPYRDNEKNVSSIPTGEYDLKLEWSPKFSMMLWEI